MDCPPCQTGKPNKLFDLINSILFIVFQHSVRRLIIEIIVFFQSLDYTATLYIIHTVLCIVYGGVPRSLSWWLTQLVCFGITTIFGEWLCMRSELREIPIVGSLTGGR